MSEIITPPGITYDASGDPVYTFTSAHTLADVARWVIKEGGREDMLYLLQNLKGEPMSKDSPNLRDNDLIRRGDVSKIVQYHVTDDDDRNTLSHAIAAVQPTVSPDVAALVEALREISIRPCNMIWGEDAEVRDAMRDMQMVADAAIARVKENGHA